MAEQSDAIKKLISYLEKAREADMTKRAAEKQLLDAGWRQDQIDAAFEEIEWSPSPQEEQGKQADKEGAAEGDQETQADSKEASSQEPTSQSVGSQNMQADSNSGSRLTSVVLAILIALILVAVAVFVYIQLSSSVTFQDLNPFSANFDF